MVLKQKVQSHGCYVLSDADFFERLHKKFKIMIDCLGSGDGFLSARDNNLL